MTFPSNYSKPKYVEEDENQESTDYTNRETKVKDSNTKDSKARTDTKRASKYTANGSSKFSKFLTLIRFK